RGWRHDGGLEGFGATMLIYPQSRIGVFIALNGRNPNPIAEERLSGIIDALNEPAPTRMPVLAYFFPVHEAFAQRFVPLDLIPALPPARTALLTGDDLRRLAGTYGGDPSEATYFPGKLTIAALGGRKVSVSANGELRIGRRTYQQIRRGLF